MADKGARLLALPEGARQKRQRVSERAGLPDFVQLYFTVQVFKRTKYYTDSASPSWPCLEVT